MSDPLASMTGFARVAGAYAPYAFAWELRAVNSKGLDLRLRLPPGFDALEPAVRAAVAKKLSRGAVQINLSTQREAQAPQVRINTALLQQLAEAARAAGQAAGLPLASLDALLAIRGVVDVVENTESEADRAGVQAAALAALEQALDALVAMRNAEGAALAKILLARCDALARLVQSAETNPARQPAAIQARLAETIRNLFGTGQNFDPQRLHQEALLLASKGDIREELDRLAVHIDAVRDLLRQGGPAGRKLDFLAQELSREANTLCAKSNDARLTATGLELRAEIEQMREQIQNVE